MNMDPSQQIHVNERNIPLRAHSVEEAPRIVNSHSQSVIQFRSKHMIKKLQTHHLGKYKTSEATNIIK